MAGKYDKTTWSDRDVEFPRNAVATKSGGGSLSSGDTVTLTPSPGTIYTTGTPMNALRFNNIESQVEYNTNELGRCISVRGVEHALYTNTGIASDVISISSGQVIGSFEMYYSGRGVKYWNNILATVTCPTDTEIRVRITEPTTSAFSPSFVASKSIGSVVSAPTGLCMKPDGTKCFVIDDSQNRISEWHLSTAGDITSATDSGNYFSLPNNIVTDISVSDDGTNLYYTNLSNNLIYWVKLATGWDISTATYTTGDNISISSLDTAPYAVFVKPDGTSIYFAGNVNDTIYQLNMSTAWDIKTATYSGYSFATAETVLRGFVFKPDGTKAYTVGTGTPGSKITQYSLSTPWTISTMTSDSITYSVSGQDTAMQGISVNPDGDKIYLIGGINDAIYQYSSGYWTLDSYNDYALLTEEVLLSAGNNTIDCTPFTDPNIRVEYRMTRESTGTTSPTVTYHSMSYNGLQHGTWIYINDATLGSDSADITITCPGSKFDEYRLVLEGYADVYNSSNRVQLRINGYSTSIYAASSVEGTSGSPSSAASLASSSLPLNVYTTVSGSVGQRFDITLQNPTTAVNGIFGNSKYTSITYAASTFNGISNSNRDICAAIDEVITSLYIYMTSGNQFVSGSKWKLYGRVNESW